MKSGPGLKLTSVAGGMIALAAALEDKHDEEACSETKICLKTSTRRMQHENELLLVEPCCCFWREESMGKYKVDIDIVEELIVVFHGFHFFMFF